MKLHGKAAIVTGASRGIGKAIAMALAKEGAAVAIAARSESQGKVPGTIYETAAKIEQAGGKALAVKCDVTTEADVKALVQKTLDAFGRVDILVNNAGGSFTYERIVNYPLSRFDRLMALNVRGVFLCCQAVLPHMVQNNRGVIINISSGAAQGFRFPGDTVYGMSKAAVERFTVGLAGEMQKHNICVVAVQPGRVKTEGALAVYPKDFDWTGWQDPEDVGPAIVWLAQQDAQSFTGRVVRTPEFGKVWP